MEQRRPLGEREISGAAAEDGILSVASVRCWGTTKAVRLLGGGAGSGSSPTADSHMKMHKAATWFQARSTFPKLLPRAERQEWSGARLPARCTKVANLFTVTVSLGWSYTS
jgi:hypothetical protein